MTRRPTAPPTHTLEAPGATLTYDIRRNDASTEPILFLIGSPMGAGRLRHARRPLRRSTVVTYDPRGSERSRRPTRPARRRPTVHADDLHRIIEALGGGPVDLFASSGGAVNALALVAKHPEDVRTLVAHEPPLASLLPDREAALAATSRDPRDLQARRLGRRHGALHRRRSATSGAVHRRGRRAARAGSGDVRDADRGRRLADRPDARLQDMLTTTSYEPDLDALRRRSDPDRHGRRRRVGGRDGQPWRVRGRRTARHGASWSSRATTAASWAASTARPVSRTPSRRSCARSSRRPPEGRPPGDRFRIGIRRRLRRAPRGRGSPFWNRARLNSRNAVLVAGYECERRGE